MEAQRASWEFALQTDSALKERLRRLDEKGKQATRKGDLLCLAIKGEIPLTVSFDELVIHVERREAKDPFCLWTLEREDFKRIFLEERPPILVAMNKDQSHIQMDKDHHHGSLVISFLVKLQECPLVS